MLLAPSCTHRVDTTLQETSDCTEDVTSTDTLRISSFKKIKFKYLEKEGDGELVDNLTTTCSTLCTNVVVDHPQPGHKIVGIKRKLSHSNCQENEEDEFRKETTTDDGLEGSSLPAPSSLYSPTLSFSNTTFINNTTTTMTGSHGSTNQPPTLASYSPKTSMIRTGTRKLRIVHDRYNPFLIDKLLELILSHFSLAQLKIVALVSKRWNLFASNRLNQLMFFTPPYDLFSPATSRLEDDHRMTDRPHDPTSYLDDGDIQEAVCGLEKIKDVVNQRLRRLSQIRRHRLTARFLLWRDNGKDKQAMPSPPPWAFWLLHAYGFPLSEFRTYTADEVFHWIMNNYQMDDQSKEEWSSLIMASNVVAFVFRPCAR